MASSLPQCDSKTFRISGTDKIDINYRDGREKLQTPRLSVAIGKAAINSYDAEIFVNKKCGSVFYEIRLNGTLKDIYDFNNPSDAQVRTDPFAWPTRLAFVALEGGTLASYKINVNLKATVNGKLHFSSSQHEGSVQIVP